MLFLASLIWIRTTYILIRESFEMGHPFLKIVLIMGGVILFTFLSIFVFETKTMKKSYKLGPEK